MTSRLSLAPVAARLAHGQFFGEHALRMETGSVVVSLMRPDPEHEVGLHTHDTAHLIVHLSGT